MKFLLWYDDTPVRSLADKVARAAAQHERKFGQAPTVCFVNPAMLEGNGHCEYPMRVEAKRTVMPNYFMIGLEVKEREDDHRPATPTHDARADQPLEAPAVDEVQASGDSAGDWLQCPDDLQELYPGWVSEPC